MTDITKHPLLEQCYELCRAIESIPPGEQQTEASVKASQLLKDIEKETDLVHDLEATPYAERLRENVVLRENVAGLEAQVEELKGAVSEVPERPYAFKLREAAYWRARASELRVALDEIIEAYFRLDPRLPADDGTRYRHSAHLKAVMDLRTLCEEHRAQVPGDNDGPRRIERLVAAFHKAITRPKGIVPKGTNEFYDQSHPALLDLVNEES